MGTETCLPKGPTSEVALEGGLTVHTPSSHSCHRHTEQEGLTRDTPRCAALHGHLRSAAKKPSSQPANASHWLSRTLGTKTGGEGGPGGLGSCSSHAGRRLLATPESRGPRCGFAGSADLLTHEQHAPSSPTLTDRTRAGQRLPRIPTSEYSFRSERQPRSSPEEAAAFTGGS